MNLIPRRGPGFSGTRTRVSTGLALVCCALPAAMLFAGSASDPVGDTFGTGTPVVDVTFFSARNGADELRIDLDFAGAISAPGSGAANAVTGFIDLDVDADAATGEASFVDFLTTFESGTGSDFYVDLLSYDSADGKVDLVSAAGSIAGRVRLDLSPSALGVRIPLALLGDDGNVRTTAVVGTPAEATDAVPNGGFLESTAVGEQVLLNGRFAVEVTWKDFAGTTGIGTVSVRSEDSAVFWFFSSANWELMVKVLDGCAVNRRFWVFSAATTNVEYTLTMTDTQTGNVQRYVNPLGAAAPAVNDTEAFTGCS